jgi:Methyltransferase domain
MSVWARAIAGGPGRPSRLHDEKGNFVPASRLLRNGPRALFSGLARLTLGIRPERPWISYDAQRVLARHLAPASKVLEFGSGMSTVWYARHSASVASVDDNEEWYALVKGVIAEQGNVDYRYAASREEYVNVPDMNFDLIVIDGSYRDACVEVSLRHIAPNGVIYLDNSDKRFDELTGDVPAAERRLLEFAEERNASVTYFTDFAPTQLFVQQGLLVCLG